MKKIITLFLILVLFFTANQDVSLASDIVIEKELTYNISYRTHVQNIGWQSYVSNSSLAGTVGQGLPIESLQIKASDISIKYQAHVQNIGWQNWVEDGSVAGTTGRGLPVEAIKIKIEDVEGYDIEYRAHVRNIGWQKWKKTGEVAGTIGQGLPIEALQIRIIKTENLILEPEVTYQTHSKNIGWQLERIEGTLAGTTNQNLPIEALKINVLDSNNTNSIEYQAHVQNIGWQNWVLEGSLVGTTGRSLPIEAIRIRIKNLDEYSIYYRVYIQNIGWQEWKKNGEIAGTTGRALNIEAIEIKIEKTGNTYNYGIDVSKHQGEIDWKAVKNTNQVDFAIIRAGFRGYGAEGTLNVDPKFSYNVKNANAVGIKVGAYFFSQAINVEEAKEESYFLLDILKGHNITYPVAIDVEYANTTHTGRADYVSREMRTQICIAFLTIIENAGYTPMVYADKYFASTNLDMSKLQKYDFWLAHYTGATQANPLIKPSDYKGNYSIWQYTSSGKIDGISGNVDLNVGYKIW